MDDAEEVTGRAKGGIARAAALSPERRSEIARRAVEARWGIKVPSAIYGSADRPIRVGNAELQCYVLDDDEETRVLTQADFLVALGRHRKANVRDEGSEEQIPPILQGKSIKPFISQELLEKSRPQGCAGCCSGIGTRQRTAADIFAVIHNRANDT